MFSEVAERVELCLFNADGTETRVELPEVGGLRFFAGRPVGRRGDELPDIAWFRPDGSLMTDADWDAAFGKAISVYLNGHGILDRDARGQRVTDDSFLLCFNAHDEAIDFELPQPEYGASWQIAVDTRVPEPDDKPVDAGGIVPVTGRSVVVLKATPS